MSSDVEPGRAGPPLSATVITFQEEDRIADCLASLEFCDEIVVVDSGSTDRTREIAESMGARVIVNVPFPGHKEQKQFAVESARHDWIFSLDADERSTPKLRERILQMRATGFGSVAYEMPRQNYYLGKPVRHGLFWPDRKIRLFHRQHASWGGTNPHDRVEIHNGAGVQRLAESFDHYSYRSFKDHLRSIDKLTRLDAEAKHAEGRRVSLIALITRPVAIFFKGLILKCGFLDGWRGFVISTMGAYYNWLKCWRLRRLNKGSGAARQQPVEVGKRTG